MARKARVEEKRWVKAEFTDTGEEGRRGGSGPQTRKCLRK